MKLIECYIENFGKIKDKRISFSEGLNCISDNNGAGKTTLSVFIKVMLYGMSDTKKASLEENDRKHYLPWDGSASRGTLTFRTSEKEYRIERSFGAKPADDTFSLYDTATGKVSDNFGSNLGESLFGIDADGFERTVFLSERALTPKSENKSVSAKLSDLVGCDGDIGVMDEAMKALEDGRKFYYKKGGSGELASIKNRILETKEQIEHLDETAILSENAEKKIKALKSELSNLYDRRSALAKEREYNTKAQAKAEVAKRYEALKKDICILTESKNDLLGFFSEGIPTYKEINSSELKLSEAKNLEKASDDSTSAEFLLLLEEYKSTNDKEVSEVRESIFEVKRKKNLENSAEYKKLCAVFSKRIPSHSEVDELITLATKGQKSRIAVPKGALFGACGALLTLGICLGLFVNPTFFVLLALGLVPIVFAFTQNKAEKNVKRDEIISDFYYSISDLPVSQSEYHEQNLAEIKSMIDRATALKKELEPGDSEARIEAFARKLGCSIADSVVFSESAIERYDRYKALALAENCKREERERRLTKAKELRLEAEAFLSLYKTDTENPFEELRKKLGSLERISADIESKIREAKGFESEFSGDINTNEVLRPAEEIQKDSELCDRSISEMEREKTLAERLIAEYSDELEKKNELSLLLKELEESFAKHKENYEVILKTKDYLEKAKDSMTAKYLGKTKAGFEKYTEIIDGIADRRFEMSTDFGVAKFEGASAKSVEAYSRGTRDLYNLAARLSLTDSLYEGEEPFIILDDPFIAFDDEKCAAALKLLCEIEKHRQIIYFTCSESRAITPSKLWNSENT